MRNKYLILILSFNFILRLFFLFSSNFFEGDDGGRYLTEGLNLFEFGVFSSEDSLAPNPTSHDLPGYPFLIYLLLKSSISLFQLPYVLGIINLIFLTLILYLVFSITKSFTKNKVVPILSVIILSLHPNLFVYTNFHMPDIIFISLTLLMVYFYLRWLRLSGKINLLLVFLFWGLSVLFKPIYIFLGLIIFVISLIIKSSSKVVIIASFLLGCLLLLPWSIRNKIEFDSYSLSSITGINLFFYNYKYLLEYQNEKNIDERLKIESERIITNQSSMNRMEASKLLSNFAAKEITSNFTDYIKTSITRQSKMYLRTSSISFFRITGDNLSVDTLNFFNSEISLNNFKKLTLSSRIYLTITLLFIVVFYFSSIVGLTALLFEREYLLLSITLFIILYYIILIGPLNDARYSLPMLPFISILSAFGTNNLFKK